MPTQAIKDIASAVQRLQKLGDALKSVEQREELIELRELLVSVRSDLVGKEEELLELRAENAELRQRIEKHHSLVEIEGFKYDDAGDGKPVGLPFCPKCEVKEAGKLYRLTRLNNEFSNCPNCNIDYNAAADGSVHRQTPMPRHQPSRTDGW